MVRPPIHVWGHPPLDSRDITDTATSGKLLDWVAGSGGWTYDVPVGLTIQDGVTLVKKHLAAISTKDHNENGKDSHNFDPPFLILEVSSQGIKLIDEDHVCSTTNSK